MTNEEIGRIASTLRRVAYDAEITVRTMRDALLAIQSLCPHEKTYVSVYEGEAAKICHTCGKNGIRP